MTAKQILWCAWAAYAVQVAIMIAAEFATAGEIGPPIDDGWIYMAFARSLAEGEGITYPGHDGPICSVTGPVWNAILALGFMVAGASALVAKSIGVLAGGFAIWAVYRLGQSATGCAKLGAVAALVIAVAPRLVWGALSVMEVPFFVATVSWGIALHLDRREQSFGRWLPALLVLWLSGWARPECFVFPVVAVLHRRGMRACVTLGGLLLLYPLYHYVGYGHPLPTTFYAKASGGAPWAIFAREGFGAAIAAAVMNPLMQIAQFVCYLPTFLPFLALGTLPGIRRAFEERSGVRFVIVAMMTFIVARGVLGVHPPHFQYGRYYGHVVALFVVVSLYGFDPARRGWRAAAGCLAAVAVSCLVFPVQSFAYVFDWITAGWNPTDDDRFGTFAVAASIAGATMLGGLLLGRPARPPLWCAVAFLVPAIAFGAVRHGRNVNDTYTMNVAMAKKIAELVPEGERVACHDIGAIGFFSDRLALDLAGLGSPEIVFGPRTPAGKLDGYRNLLEHKPRYLCLTPAMYDAVLDGKQELPGLKVFEMLHLIEHPDNITLLGNQYFLAKLTWE